MKLKMAVGDLVEQVSLCAITIDPKSVDQPNSKIYLKAMKAGEEGVLYSYSTNQMARTFIRKQAEIVDPGEVLIDSQRLLGGLANRDPKAECRLDTGVEKTVVKIGKSSFSIPNSVGAERMSEEVNNLPFRNSAFCSIPSSLLTEFIKRASFCIPVNMNGQSAWALDSMMLQRSAGAYHAFGSDGNIINHNYGPTVEGEKDTEAILIPQESIFQLQKLVTKQDDENVDLVSNVVGNDNKTREVFFRMRGMLFGCRLKAGRYPDLTKLINQNPIDFEIDAPRDDLRGALIRAGNFNEEGKRIVSFVFDEQGAMKIRAGQNADTNLRDETPVELVSGDFGMMKTALNLDYVSNAVGMIPGDKTRIGLSSKRAHAAIVVKGEDKDKDGAMTIGSVYVVNPVKLEKEA